MASYNQPFPGQTLAKTYSTQWAYQREANKLAIQGWSVQSTTMHDVGRRRKRPEVLVTYVYRPMMVNASAPLSPLAAPTVVAPPPGSWAWTPAAPPPPPPPPLPLYQFPIWEAILVAILMVGGFVLGGNGVSAGIVLMLAGIVWVIVRDGRGLRSIRNLFNWEAMSGGGKTLLILGILSLWVFFLPIYLVRVLIDSFRSRREAALSAPLLTKQRTAELESQLGIVPSVEGECRKCQKPLQVGAEYCAYCGEPVVLRPRICPVCATTALPDARFCPQCRTELPPYV